MPTAPPARLCAAFIGIALTACSTPPVGHKDLLEFLDRGDVSREQVISGLGRAHETFESGRVLTYRIGENASGYFIVPPPKGWEDLEICAPWSGVNYDLVLVFDGEGLLVRKNLVTIRATEPSKHEKN